MNSNKSLLKFLILCLVTIITLPVHASVLCDYDFTDDYDASKVTYRQQYEALPQDCMAKLINHDAFIDPVVEFYDTKGNKHMLSLLVKNKPVKDSIDARKPMILHLMVDDDEIPLKYYKFLTTCWMDHTVFVSNKKEISSDGKWFIKKSEHCKSFFLYLAPDDSPTEVFPIGPFSKVR